MLSRKVREAVEDVTLVTIAALGIMAIIGLGAAIVVALVKLGNIGG